MNGSIFRRKGLASVVMMEGMRRMQARGATTVVVGPIEYSDTRARALYQVLGFREMDRIFAYEKRNHENS